MAAVMGMPAAFVLADASTLAGTTLLTAPHRLSAVWFVPAQPAKQAEAAPEGVEHEPGPGNRVVLGQGRPRDMVGGRMQVALCLTVALSLFAGESWAEEKEPSAIAEWGTAGEWDFPSGKFGQTAAVEFTPIKDWLEIEAVSTLFGGGQTESRSLCLTKWNSCSGSGQNGRSRAMGPKLLVRLLQISCSGRRRIESSDGS
jgi:hypothetical protein